MLLYKKVLLMTFGTTVVRISSFIENCFIFMNKLPFFYVLS